MSNRREPWVRRSASIYEVPGENSHRRARLEALLFQRYVAKLRFELGFWSRFADDGGTPGGYSENLTSATGVSYRSDAYLADMGFPVRAGDTLVYSWSVNNGSGPPVYFEIHGHPPGRYDVFYNTTAISVNGTWTARVQEPYMVFWRNDQTVVVNVTYAFNLVPGQSDIWPLYLAPLAIALVAVAGAYATLKERRTRRTR